MLEFISIKAFNDNYIWLLKNSATKTCVVVDPGESIGVLNWLNANCAFKLEAILITHHHQDHTAGIAEIKSHTKAVVYAPQNEPILADFALQGTENLQLITAQIQAIATPGHTKGHLSYLAHNNLLCGDTLFAGGCGRVFEGTYAQMYSSLICLANLPTPTKIYCAHEYTLSNLQFAHKVEPHNLEINTRIQKVSQLRAQNLPSVPSILQDELRTNPFLRCHKNEVKQSVSLYAKQNLTDELAIFTVLRQWKDNF